jgi:hypothetical protein
MFTRFLIIILFASANSCYSQNCLDIILSKRIFTKQGDIINGRQWINEKHYSGSPLLIQKYWPDGEVFYNGLHYSGQTINYDLSREEMIIYCQDRGMAKFVVISNEKLEGFNFTDTVSNRRHSYEYRELDGIKGTALYENASQGKIRFYIKPIKKIELRSVRDGSGEYYDRYEYYLKGSEGFVRVTSKGQLIKLLQTHEDLLKRYIRDHNFKLSDRNPENIIDLISYCNSLD